MRGSGWPAREMAETLAAGRPRVRGPGRLQQRCLSLAAKWDREGKSAEAQELRELVLGKPAALHG